MRALFRKLILLVGAAISLVETRADSLASLADASAYCETLRYGADAFAFSHLAPNLTGSLFQGTESGVGSLPGDTGSYRRIRVGLEYDLVDLFRNSVHQQLVDVACRSRVAGSSLGATLSQADLEQRLSMVSAQKKGVEAALKVLESGSPNLDKAGLLYRNSLDKGRATVVDMTTVSDVVLSANVLESDLKAESRRLVALENQILSQLGPVRIISRRQLANETTVENAKNEVSLARLREIELRQAETGLNNYSVSLFGGYQDLSGTSVSGNSGGAYFGAQLKINLGAAAYSAFGEDPGTRQALLTAIRNHELQDSAKADKDSRVTQLKERVAYMRDRLIDLGHLLRISRTTEKNLDATIGALKLYSNHLLSKAQLASAETELASLVSASIPKAATRQVAAQTWKKTDVKNYRFVQAATNADMASLRFVIDKEMEDPKALGSGAIRYQFGVMLRQQNQCNLVYAMVRLGPSPSVVVQEKVNPGQSTHEQCQNNGYKTVKGTAVTSIPTDIKMGEHELGAKITSQAIEVYFDEKLVWTGALPKSITSGTNIGMRADNLEMRFQLSDN